MTQRIPRRPREWSQHGLAHQIPINKLPYHPQASTARDAQFLSFHPARIQCPSQTKLLGHPRDKVCTFPTRPTLNSLLLSLTQVSSSQADCDFKTCTALMLHLRTQTHTRILLRAILAVHSTHTDCALGKKWTAHWKMDKKPCQLPSVATQQPKSCHPHSNHLYTSTFSPTPLTT